MPQNSEQIEAKLCAYIDGELDAGGRAEIEKYLQNNPQHRKLMAELVQQREVLGQLPRESAPADVLEAIQGQLERSVLLDGDDDVAAGAVLRMNLWPKVFAAAAVLLLAVGLAAVVMYVMPPSGSQPGTYAIRQDEADEVASRQPAPSLEGTAPLARRETEAFRADDLRLQPGPDAVADGAAMREADEAPLDRPLDSSFALTHRGGTLHDDPPIPPPSVTAPRYWSALLSPEGMPPPAVAWMLPSEVPSTDPPDHAALGTTRMENRLAEVRPETGEMLFRDIERVGDRLGHALFMVVETDDPARANVDLVNFLASNSIAWSEVTEPMPEPLQIRQQQVVTMSRLQQVEGRLRAVAPEADSSETREGVEIEQNGWEQDGISRRERPGRRVASGEAGRDVDAAWHAPRTDGMTGDAEHSDRERFEGIGGGGFGEGGLTRAPQPPERQQLEEQLPQQFAPQMREGENLIVARGMSIKQAEELQKSLYQPHAKQRAQVVEQVQAEQRAISGPADSQPSRQMRVALQAIPPRSAQRPEQLAVPPATQPAGEPAEAQEAPPIASDEADDRPHELPVELDDVDPADQVDVYVIILQNTDTETEAAEQGMSDTSETRDNDESVSPPADRPPAPAESAAEPE